MADYSIEFVFTHFEDPEFPWDFCIEDIGMTLQPEEYVPIVCEGYGFTGIYMTPEGERSVIFNLEETEGGNTIEVVSVVDLDRLYSEGNLPWQR